MEKYTNLKEMVYNAVLQEIISGKYQPGDILNEKKLIEKYEVSKSPVRDALIALCADGVVQSIPRYGYEVIRLTHIDIYEMLQYREAEIELLKQLNRNCQRDDVDPIQHWRFNMDFHEKLMEFCGNTFITMNVKRCMSRLLRAYSQLYWNRRADRLLSYDTKHHELIIADLARKDPEALVRDIRDDLRDFGGYMGL